MSNITLKSLLILWLWQTGVLLITTAIVAFFDYIHAYSLLVGGIIYIIPNMYFALYAFRYRGAQAAQMVLASFYRGEIGKFLLSGVGFAMAFTFVKPLDILWLFSAYIVLTIVQWIQLAKIRR